MNENSRTKGPNSWTSITNVESEGKQMDKQIKFTIQTLPRNFYPFRRTNKMAKVFPYNYKLTDENLNSVDKVDLPKNQEPKEQAGSPIVSPPIIILDEVEETVNEKTPITKPIEPEITVVPQEPECVVIECEREKKYDEVCIIEEVPNQTHEALEKFYETISDSDCETVEVVDKDKNHVNGNTSRPNSFYIRQINVEVKIDVLKILFTQLKNDVKKKYPDYGKYFKKMFKKLGYHFCEIESYRLPFEILKRNNWRFLCMRIPENKSDSNSTTQADLTSDISYVWKIRSTYDQNVDIGWDSPYPYNVISLIKALENYFNNHIKLPAKVHDNEKIDIVMQRNSRSEIMVIVVAHDIEIDIYNNLHDFVIEAVKTMTFLKGFQYLTDVSGKQDENKKTVLYGEDNLVETIQDLTIEIPSDPEVVVNYNYDKHLSQIIECFLKPYRDTVLFELNCKTSLSTLLLASKYKEVIGFGDRDSIEKINTVIDQNNILNANFNSDEIETASELNKIQNVVPISVVINIDQHQCEFFHFVLNELLSQTTLKRLVLVTESLENSQDTLFDIMKPRFSTLFVPVYCKIVDKLLDNDTHSVVIFMERVHALKLRHFFAKRKRAQSSKDVDKNEEKGELNELLAKKRKIETWIEECNSQVCDEETIETSQTNTDEQKEPSPTRCDKNLSSDSFKLKEQIFDELIIAMTDCFDDETEEALTTLSDKKIDQSPVENNGKSKISEEVVETLLKSSKKSPVKKINGIEKVGDKEKIVQYSKRLQDKLNEILSYMKKHAHTMDPKLATEIKLMTSSMLKTGIKVQEKIGIRRRTKN